jgi:dihydrodipicolinate synthase/N-acetylneuraminate lyase
VRENPAVDPYLTKLIDIVDRKLIVSGIGEQPAIIHLRDFGITGFTSGCVCVAPALSMKCMNAIHREDYAEAERIRAIFEPLEDQRNSYGPIPVLHHAVALAGVADTGPFLPLLAPLADERLPAIKQAAAELLAQNVA